MADDEVKHWIYAGGIDYYLTEGDLITVFSQYGEVEDFVLSRDRDTGKPRGFGFAKYADPRSCELAVDNFNGTTISNRRLKVNYANNLEVIKSIKSKVIKTFQNDKEGGSPRRSAPAYCNNNLGDSRRPIHGGFRNRSDSSSSEIERRPRERVPYRDDFRTERRHYDSSDLRNNMNRDREDHYRTDFTFTHRNGIDKPPMRHDDHLRRPRDRSRSSSSSSVSSSTSSSSSSSTSSSSSSSSASGHKRRGRKDSHKKKSSRRHKHRRHHKSKSSKYVRSSADEGSSKRHRIRKSKRPNPASHQKKRKSKKTLRKDRSRSKSPSKSTNHESKTHAHRQSNKKD